jgi:predicted dehydrogenase
MAEALRVAVVGLGRHMFDSLYGGLRYVPGHKVVAAVDRDPDRLARFTAFYNVPAGYADLSEMLAREAPNVVILAVSKEEHAGMAAAAMRAGAHVFIEKTPASGYAEALELVEVQKQTGRFAMVGFNRRFLQSYMRARAISARAEFGGVNMYFSQTHSKPYRDEEFFKANHLIHHLDLARFIMGEIELTQVRRVFVDAHHMGFDISFVSPGGGIGTIQSGALLDDSHPMERMQLLGRDRAVVVENFRNVIYHRPPSDKIDWEQYKAPDCEDGSQSWNEDYRFQSYSGQRGFENELVHFLGRVAAGIKPEPDIEDSARTMRLLEDMDRFLKSPSAR